MHGQHTWRPYQSHVRRLYGAVYGSCTLRLLLLSMWLPVSYNRYDLNILCYQQYSMIPGTKGQSTFHPIRYRCVPGTCMYVMNTSHTERPALGFSIYDVRSLVFRIFCRTARESTYICRYYTRAIACYSLWIPFPFLDNVHSRHYTPRMRCGLCCAWCNPVEYIRVHALTTHTDRCEA